MDTVPKAVDVQPRSDAHLTDNNIQQLLAEAEQRLRNTTTDITHPSSEQNLPKYATPRLPEEELSLKAMRNNVFSNISIPKLSSESSLKPYLRQQNDFAVVDSSRIGARVDENQSLASKGIAPTLPSKKDKPTAGSDWFDMPQTELTPELKRDLQLLRMRSILDPKRHYKKESGKAQPPPFSQVGTIVEGPTEFFSGRIAKRDRKKTFVDEALVLEKENRRFETRYNDVQDRKRSGKKAFYKNLQAKRSGGKNRH